MAIVCSFEHLFEAIKLILNLGCDSYVANDLTLFNQIIGCDSRTNVTVTD